LLSVASKCILCEQSKLTGDCAVRNIQPTCFICDVEVEVNLRPTVSRPVFLGVGIPSGSHDQISFISLTIAGFLIRDTLSDERMDL
jgi:hypothetical protein